MFTGIIEEIGTVKKVTKKRNLSELVVGAKKIVKGARVGDSVAINGACLTITKVLKTSLTFEVMLESLKATTLGQCQRGERVNLERALKANGRLDGHIVTGHVDAVVKVKDRIERKNYCEFVLSSKKSLQKYLVSKGSVCLEGVSLTVGKVSKASFSVYLIPHTLSVTTLGEKKKNDTINIETDILAKYILNKRK